MARMGNKWWFAGIMDDGTFIVEPVKHEIDYRETFGVDGRIHRQPSLWLTAQYTQQPDRAAFIQKFERISGFTLPRWITEGQ